MKVVADREEAEHAAKSIWKSHYEKRPFEQILIEPKIEAAREYYVSFTFDGETRSPLLVLSKFGGMDIEVVAKRQPQAVVKLAINPLKGLTDIHWEDLFTKADFSEDIRDSLKEFIKNLYQVFTENDAELSEVNPLLETSDGRLIAVDCKINIDDTALYRHEFSFPRRTGFRELTDMEKKAREIDARSHRGVVGRTLLELDGDIAVMSSGGGASITCLDALITYGGRPACFAEYSGNPEREDVKDLAKLILSKKGLRALWLVGPTANFTDVYETLGGIMDAIKEIKPQFPIIIRRAGPRDDEARQMVKEFAKESGLDIVFYGEDLSMTESAKLLMDKIGPSPE